MTENEAQPVECYTQVFALGGGGGFAGINDSNTFSC